MISACWMRRSVGEPVSALLIDSNNDIIAGGRDGILIKWSAEGDELWSTQMPNRIGSIIIAEKGIYVCAGLHLVAVDPNTGKLLWQQALEGSADEITTINGLIYATSSVYDIEHNDFIDSAVWCFNSVGEKVWETHMAERPWAMLVTNGQLILGLGRPKMGAAFVDNDGNLTHVTLKSESPVTTGTDSINGAIFGHANGDLTTTSGKSWTGSGASISSINAADNGQLIISNEEELITLNSNFEQAWVENLDPISTVSSGICVDEKPTIWVGINDGSKGILKVLLQEGGQLVSAMNCGKITSINSNGRMVAVGDEEGELFVWQDEMFNRRLINDEPDENDERRQSMRERLKVLRGR